MIKYADYARYVLIKHLGIQPSEALMMEADFARRCIEWQQKEDYDERMVDKIDFFGAHGIDVRKPSVIGTDIYQRWMNEKQKERFDELEKQMADKLNKEIKLAPEIDAVIVGKRLKAQHGK